ncbi:hypothetical protein WICPIJ_003277 [Wickerhamomyces pijperi]|uniref:Cell wall protein CWP1 n=1 Tax=Wickerhamomyces pijperi TaxID=599730 RepID=A0A9P8TN60_WICPI|nr:hypothetical protein WICPIJ_003277 [Wickerhamomyces pijperi]
MFSKTLLALSLASLAIADSVEFGLITIRSGSAYHLLSIYPKDGELVAGSTDVSNNFVVTDAGELKLVNDGTFAAVASDNTIKFGSTDPSTKFFLQDGYLQYDTTSVGFSVDTSYQLLTGSSGTGVALRTVTKGGSVAPDFIPSADSTTSSSSEAVSSATATSTFTTITNKNGTSNSTVPPVTVEEGSGNYLNAGVNVAALAAMAALIL